MKTPTENFGAAVTAPVPVDRIRPDPKNRKDFAFDDIVSLAESIRTEGLLQPIVVKRLAEEEVSADGCMFQIIAGERRWLAHRELKRDMIEARVLDIVAGDTVSTITKRAVENLQRVNLTPIETADVYQELIDAGKTHAEVARIAGESQPTISNTLRLLRLPLDVQTLVNEGLLTRAHGVALVRFAKWPDACAAIACVALEKGVPAKELEGEGVPFYWDPRVSKHVGRHYFGKLPAEIEKDEDCLSSAGWVFSFNPGRLSKFISRVEKQEAPTAAAKKGAAVPPDQAREMAKRAAARERNTKRRGELSMQFARALSVLQQTKICNSLMVSILASEAVVGGFVATRIREVADRLGLKCAPGVIPTGGGNGLRNVDAMAKMDPCDVLKLAVGVILSKETDDAIKDPTGFTPVHLNRVVATMKNNVVKAPPLKPASAPKPKAGSKAKRTAITDATYAEVKKLVFSGRTGTEIAKEVGISLPSVQNIKKRLGLVKAGVAKKGGRN